MKFSASLLLLFVFLTAEGRVDINTISCTSYPSGFAISRQIDGSFAGGWSHKFLGSNNLKCVNGSGSSLSCTGTMYDGGGEPIYAEVAKLGDAFIGSLNGPGVQSANMPCRAY